MNPILLSFLCGAAFIGGACVTTVLIVIARSAASKKDRDEAMANWRKTHQFHEQQADALYRIAEALERK